MTCKASKPLTQQEPTVTNTWWMQQHDGKSTRQHHDNFHYYFPCHASLQTHLWQKPQQTLRKNRQECRAYAKLSFPSYVLPVFDSQLVDLDRAVSSASIKPEQFDIHNTGTTSVTLILVTHVIGLKTKKSFSSITAVWTVSQAYHAEYSSSMKTYFPDALWDPWLMQGKKFSYSSVVFLLLLDVDCHQSFPCLPFPTLHELPCL